MKLETVFWWIFIGVAVGVLLNWIVNANAAAKFQPGGATKTPAGGATGSF